MATSWVRSAFYTLLFLSFFSTGNVMGQDNLNEVLKRKDKAILFGTDQYDEFPDLNNPITDVRAMEKELQDRFGFETEVVTNATTDEVIMHLRKYALAEYQPFDQLLILFAGHGTYDDVFKEGYLVAKNSKFDDETYNSYISHARLRNVVNNIPSNHVLLVIDACFSGTFNPEVDRGNLYKEKSNLEFVRNKMKYRTRKYLTSGGKEYVSDGIKGRHSPFAAKFLEALRSQGGKDGILTLAETYNHMEKIAPTPHYGSFGENEPGSDFLFISKGKLEQRESNQPIPDLIERPVMELPKSTFHFNPLGLIQFGPVFTQEIRFLSESTYLAPYLRYGYLGVLTHLDWDADEVSPLNVGNGVQYRRYILTARGNAFYLGAGPEIYFGRATNKVGTPEERTETLWGLPAAAVVGHRWRFPSGKMINVGVVTGVMFTIREEWRATADNSVINSFNKTKTFVVMLELSFGREKY